MLTTSDAQGILPRSYHHGIVNLNAKHLHFRLCSPRLRVTIRHNCNLTLVLGEKEREREFHLAANSPSSYHFAIASNFPHLHRCIENDISRYIFHLSSFREHAIQPQFSQIPERIISKKLLATGNLWQNEYYIYRERESTNNLSMYHRRVVFHEFSNSKLIAITRIS